MLPKTLAYEINKIFDYLTHLNGSPLANSLFFYGAFLPQKEVQSLLVAMQVVNQMNVRLTNDTLYPYMHAYLKLLQK